VSAPIPSPEELVERAERTEAAESDVDIEQEEPRAESDLALEILMNAVIAAKHAANAAERALKSYLLGIERRARGDEYADSDVLRATPRSSKFHQTFMARAVHLSSSSESQTPPAKE
jgi:hypothetical protein